MQQFIVIPYQSLLAVLEAEWSVEKSEDQVLIGVDPMTREKAICVVSIVQDLTDEAKADIPYKLRSVEFVAAYKRQMSDYFYPESDPDMMEENI